MNIYRYTAAGVKDGKVRAVSEAEALKIAKRKIRQGLLKAGTGTMPQVVIALDVPVTNQQPQSSQPQ